MDGGLTGVSRSLPFTSSPYEVAPAPTSTSVSSMSMSHSTGGKGTGTTVPKVSGSKHPLQSSSGGRGSGGVLPKNARKKVGGFLSSQDNAEDEGEGGQSDKDDDKDTDYVPVTDAAINNMMEGGDCGEMAAIIAMHRRAFMERAFPPEEQEDNHPQKKSGSIQNARPQEEFDYIQYVVQRWQPDKEIRHMLPGPERDQLLEFRREHRSAYKYIKQYYLEDIVVPGEDQPKTIVRRYEDTGKNRIVVSREKVFDAIDEWHRESGHMGQERTWTYVSNKYWNITQKTTRIYVETCLICMKKNPPTKNVKGSIKPIRSWKFCDRFQFDLIDFRKLRKRDPFGVLMRWVLTLKDHATGLTYLCALPRKRPHLVAYKLQEIFGAIGYPKIFHTDNGKEFTAKSILKFLRHLNPNILSVTGRPRRPRDQGSVENMNKLVKRVLGSVLAERRLAGDNTNWTEVLGTVAAVVNSQAGRGKNDVSAYEAVFGQPYHHQFSCSKEDARKCWTIDERMLVTNDAEFNENVAMDYNIGDNASDVADEDDGYFSDDEVPADETEEVTDEYFYAHLNDGTESLSLPKEHKRPVEVEFQEESKYLEPPQKDKIEDHHAPPATVGNMEGDHSTNVNYDEDMDDRKPSASEDKGDDNGLELRPLCVRDCLKAAGCEHSNQVKVSLNQVGDYVAFPSLWYHRGFYHIQSEGMVIFQAQLFATPSSGILHDTRTVRSSIAMTSHRVGNFCIKREVTLEPLVHDLLRHWDDKYSAEQFPPSSKFQDKLIDRSKNRHIRSNQIHLLPMIQQLCIAFEELIGGITVDSVWLLKKSKDDDGFQGWHQDMPHKITTTIVVNVGVASLTRKPSLLNSGEEISPEKSYDTEEEILKYTNKMMEDEVKVTDALNSQPAKDDHSKRAKDDDSDDDSDAVVWERPKSKWGEQSKGFTFVSIEEGWKQLSAKKEHEGWLPCRLLCEECQVMLGRIMTIPIGDVKYMNRHRNTDNWWGTTFMTGFVIMVQHDAHMSVPPFKNPGKRIMLVSKQSYLPPKTPNDLQDCGHATHLVSWAYNKSHFVVLQYDILNREVTVYDGLRWSIANWVKQIIGTIKLFGFKAHNAKCHQAKKDITIVLHFDDSSPWTVRLDISYRQSDGINCGPIACLKLMELYGFLKEGSIDRIGESPGGYRNAVMDYYQNCCILYYDALKAELRTKKLVTDDPKEDAGAVVTEKKNAKQPSSNPTDDARDDARKSALQKKNAKQQASAEKEMKRAGKAAMESGAAPGAVVTLHVDYRTHSHAQGLIAIVYSVKEKTGGILVCCEHGVITHSGTKADYWVPADKYMVVAKKDEGIPLPAQIDTVRNSVLRGEFQPKTWPRISYAKYHEVSINATSPIKRNKGCQCKGGSCTKACGCKKKGVTCHSGCSCLGNCSA